MSIVEPDRSSTRKFLTVVCPCGRSLRAPVDMAGQEISCWECHRMVRVPVPRSPERAYRLIVEGLKEVFEGRWLIPLFLIAAVLAGVLCIPYYGVPVGAAVLVLGALGYGELIRQCGIDYWDFDDWLRPGTLLQRLAVSVLFGLSLAAPMLLAPRGFGHPPRFSTLGLLAGIVAALVLPVLMFLAFARDEDGPLGWGRGARLMVRYPMATLLALMLIPLGVVACELLVIAFSCWHGVFRFFLLELYPDSVYYAEQYKIPKWGNYTRPLFPDERFVHLYLRRLHQGFTFTGSLPASLAGKTAVLESPWTLELLDSDYLWLRLIYTQVIATILALFLGLQSRWLGALSTLESKRSVEASSP
jgi:hypothetical protein